MNKVMYFYLLLVALFAVSNKANAASVKDIDGNEYHTVTIGDQTWLVENLKTTKYRNGDAIPYVTDSVAWRSLITGAQCIYNNDEANVKKYGRLYNWYAVNDVRNIAPIGYHVASRGEWHLLEDYLIANGYNYDKKDIGRNYAKSLAATTDWKGFLKPGKAESMIGNDIGANNSTGFTALPSGFFGSKGSGGFEITGFWWTTSQKTTTAWAAYLTLLSPCIELSHFKKSDGCSVRCIKDSKPILITSSVVISTNSTATLGGNIYTDGGCTITSHGVCWSTSSKPTIKLDTKTIETSNLDSLEQFKSSINGLINNKTYYVRAYVTYRYGNATDVVYGNEQRFKFNSETIPITDIDGNVYHTVKIGKQIWTVENLKVTKYNDGSPIPNVTDDKVWKETMKGVLCAYKNHVEYVSVYGYLYNWYAVNDPRKLAPNGWHVATDEEWTTLIDYLGGDKDAGGMLKKANTLNWESPNIKATNESGFNALPSGIREFNGTAGNCGREGVWWSATPYFTFPSAWTRYIVTNNAGIGRKAMVKSTGCSVRCVKD